MDALSDFPRLKVADCRCLIEGLCDVFVDELSEGHRIYLRGIGCEFIRDKAMRAKGSTIKTNLGVFKVERDFMKPMRTLEISSLGASGRLGLVSRYKALQPKDFLFQLKNITS